MICPLLSLPQLFHLLKWDQSNISLHLCPTVRMNYCKPLSPPHPPFQPLSYVQPLHFQPLSYVQLLTVSRELWLVDHTTIPLTTLWVSWRQECHLIPSIHQHHMLLHRVGAQQRLNLVFPVNPYQQINKLCEKSSSFFFLNSQPSSFTFDFLHWPPHLLFAPWDTP